MRRAELHPGNVVAVAKTGYTRAARRATVASVDEKIPARSPCVLVRYDDGETEWIRPRHVFHYWAPHAENLRSLGMSDEAIEAAASRPR